MDERQQKNHHCPVEKAGSRLAPGRNKTKGSETSPLPCRQSAAPARNMTKSTGRGSGLERDEGQSRGVGAIAWVEGLGERDGSEESVWRRGERVEERGAVRSEACGWRRGERVAVRCRELAAEEITPGRTTAAPAPHSYLVAGAPGSAPTAQRRFRCMWLCRGCGQSVESRTRRAQKGRQWPKERADAGKKGAVGVSEAAVER
eukprot:351309-Chlamydomonas_euryale.AAC.14